MEGRKGGGKAREGGWERIGKSICLRSYEYVDVCRRNEKACAKGVRRGLMGRRANLLRMHVFAFNTFFDDVDRGVSSTCARVHAYVWEDQRASGVPLKYSPCQSRAAKCGRRFPWASEFKAAPETRMLRKKNDTPLLLPSLPTLLPRKMRVIQRTSVHIVLCRGWR